MRNLTKWFSAVINTNSTRCECCNLRRASIYSGLSPQGKRGLKQSALLCYGSKCSSSSSAGRSDSHDILLQKQTRLNHNQLSNDTVECFKLAVSMDQSVHQVAVVTAGSYQHETKSWLKRGITCRSFSSMSYQPPMISFCIHQGCHIQDVIGTTRKFALHILAEDQVRYGLHFSKPAKDVCQLECVPHTQEDGLPIISDTLAVLLCDLHSFHGVGDHAVWYGNVYDASVSETKQKPLTYVRRKFHSLGDEIFLKAFEDTTLPFEDWTHQAHLRVAWNYIKEHGRKEAVSYIRSGIQRYNEQHKEKLKIGYHETITMFFIHLVSDAVEFSANATESFEEFLSQNQYLTKKDLLTEYYNKETLFQEEARRMFVHPDKKSLSGCDIGSA